MPDFKPSIAPEKATSFDQALSGCAEYQIISERVDQVKVVEMVPWIRCFEQVIRRFPEARENQEFVVFFSALSKRYEYVAAPNDWIADPAKLNAVVAHVIQTTRNQAAGNSDPGLRLTDPLYRYAQREFPRYAEFVEYRHGGLNTHRPYKSDNTQQKEELGPLADDLSQSLNVRTNGKSRKQITKSLKPYCEKERQYLEQVENLRQLMEYRDTLDREGLNHDLALKSRVTQRIREMRDSLLDERQSFLIEFAELQKQNPGFERGDCWRSN